MLQSHHVMQAVEGAWRRSTHSTHSASNRPLASCRSYAGRFAGVTLSTSQVPGSSGSELKQDMYCCAKCIKSQACEMWMVHGTTCTLMADAPETPFDPTQTDYRGNWRNQAPPRGCGKEDAADLGSSCYTETDQDSNEEYIQVPCIM